VQDDLPVLEASHATALFRIVQESLTNIARHADAEHVEVALAVKENRLKLTVRDDGRGITTTELRDLKSIGLLGMKERAALLGGETEIEAEPGGGTFVRVDIPLSPTHEKEVL
jgi:signal transduction histidine kinase